MTAYPSAAANSGLTLSCTGLAFGEPVKSTLGAMSELTEVNLRNEFSAFLSCLAKGELESGAWNRYVVTHYAESELESARVELVCASIESGEWSIVPNRVREVAHALLSRIK